MKFTTAYYFALLYIAILFKPLLPMLSDVWSHEFNAIEHIATVHAKYGCHHLQKEVANSAGENNKKGQNSLKADDQLSYHVGQEEIKYNFSSKNNNKLYVIFTCAKIPFIHLSNLAPPPKKYV